MQQVAWLLATYSACTSALRPAAYTPSRAPTKLAATTPSLGLYGDWEPSAGGSYVLEAADGPANAKGVVHFLGGAFVGAGADNAGYTPNPAVEYAGGSLGQLMAGTLRGGAMSSLF